MIITLYSFSKKRNSTRRPNSGGLDVEVKLKENCSIYNPTFVLNHNAGDFNYVKVSAQQGEQYWKSTKDLYYWVDDITFLTDRIISAQCSLDPFASAKEDILATTANIMYCADSIYNNIVDQRLPIYSDVYYNETSLDLGSINPPEPYEGSSLMITDLASDNPVLSIILAVTGKGSFGSYLMYDPNDVKEILDGIDGFSQGITDILTGLKQLFYGGTASECMKAAFALPISLNNIDVGASSTEELYLGNYPAKKEIIVSEDTKILLPIYVYPINKKILKGKYRLNIPWTTPEGWQRSAPYRQLILYFPFVGLVPLNSSEMISDIFVDVSYSINLTSGDIAISVEGVRETTLETRIVATASGNMALNTPFGSTGIDTNRLTQSIGAGVAATGASLAMAATGNIAGAALTLAGGIAGAAASGISAMGGTGQGSGGLGGGASSGLDRRIRLFVIGHTLTATPDTWAATYGKPYMRPDTIGNHTGLVITEGASVSSDLSATIIDTINAGLDGGLYIE